MNLAQHKTHLRLVLAVLFSIGLIACGGGGQLLQPGPDGANTGLQPDRQQPGPAVDNGAGGTEDPVAERSANVIALQTPSLAGLNTGSEFEVVLSAELVEEVYQGSFRLLFDPALLQPVSTERGGLLRDGMLQIAALDQPGFVPFSFTALPGDPGIAAGSGELLRVRFRLLAPVDGTQRPRLQNDAEFLQLRDRNSRRLNFDLQARSGGAQ